MAVLLPSTFRNPQSAFGWPGGPTGAAHYVAGGGGGSSAGNSFDVGGGGGAPQGDKAGVPNANLPNHQWGGAGMDVISYTIAMEEISRIDGTKQEYAFGDQGKSP